ncbi:MAG: transcription termination factor NusA [Clostridia bacterium]|nr:transcription termination factor NusA [Clostridia bacterium]
MAKQEEEGKLNVLEAIRALAEERGIDDEKLIRAVEEGIVTAFRREFSASKTNENVHAEIDREDGTISLYKVIEVVEEVMDPDKEMSLEDAKSMDPDFEIGDEFEMGLEVQNLGRLAATAAKSAISQKIREAEFERIKDEYEGRIGEMTSGKILRRDNRCVYVDIEKRNNKNFDVDTITSRTEATLSQDEKVKTEIYKENAVMYFIIQGVQEQKGRPSVILSRKSPVLVTKLFELNVPEILRGEVIVYNVAREAGSRSKVAVYSRSEGVDAKGSCVGQRGQRVQAVMDALQGEKIDIVEWNEDPAIFIKEALQPAKAVSVETEITVREDGTEDKQALVIVPDSQFSLAIGKSGQNVRLAAKLTGFKIDIKKESDCSSSDVDDILNDFVPDEQNAVESEE